MTTDELRRKIESYRILGGGHYRITISYRNRFYTCTSCNSLAIDRLRDWDECTDKVARYGYTFKGACKALYDECKRKNALGEYKYV